MVGIALIATAATLSHAQNIVRVHVDASTSLEQVLGDDWADIDCSVFHNNSILTDFLSIEHTVILSK